AATARRAPVRATSSTCRIKRRLMSASPVGRDRGPRGASRPPRRASRSRAGPKVYAPYRVLRNGFLPYSAFRRARGAILLRRRHDAPAHGPAAPMLWEVGGPGRGGRKIPPGPAPFVWPISIITTVDESGSTPRRPYATRASTGRIGAASSRLAQK